MRCCTAIPPPSARTRSRLRSVTVSAWSKNQRKPLNGTSRLTASKTSRNHPRRFRPPAFRQDLPTIEPCFDQRIAVVYWNDLGRGCQGANQQLIAPVLPTADRSVPS